MLKNLINAINGSKVLISGSVLIRTHVPLCFSQSWSVVTQTADSSSNLFYGPPDVTAFCAEPKDDPTLLVVLPVHAIWASVYGVFPVKETLEDPTWRSNPPPPPGHECASPDPKDGDKNTKIWDVPSQGIRNCSLNSSPAWRFFGAEYNRVTLPGVSQGSISTVPWASATKATWDMQAYESTRWGPGWFGLQLMYEHDRKLADDFNSFTAALTYDLRIPAKGRQFWFDWGTPNGDAAQTPKKCSPGEKGNVCVPPLGPPLLGIRPLEFITRAGLEWSPSAENKATSAQAVYMPEDKNLVMGVTARLPVVISPIGRHGIRQPSQFTVVPVWGLEGGFRVDSHPICAPVLSPSYVPIAGPGQCEAPPNSPIVPAFAPCPDTSSTTTNNATCPQPQEIFRQVAGVDVSARWPYNTFKNFLGDRPITLEFSYRVRRLSYAEPFYNGTQTPFKAGPTSSTLTSVQYPEGQSSGDRYYIRATFIIPVSAYFQFRATWQRGSLPPLFQFVGSETTLGLTFSNPGSSEH
jgi:hypothetical protein